MHILYWFMEPGPVKTIAAPPTFIPHGCVKSEEWQAAYQTFFVRSFDKSGMADVILSTFAKFLEAALLVACSPLDPLGGC